MNTASQIRGVYSQVIFARACLIGVWLVLAVEIRISDAQQADANSTMMSQVINLYSAGEYDKALPLAEHYLAHSEESFGTNNPQIVDGLNMLGVICQQMGYSMRAESLLVRALNLNEQFYGPDASETAVSFNNLAEVYQNMGDYAKAEPLFQRSLNIRENIGADLPSTAVAMNNLAMLYEKMGDYAKAEPLLRNALDIWEKMSVANKPDAAGTAKCLGNLGVVCDDMGRFAEAELYFQRALSIREKVLGPGHPDTTVSRISLADLYMQTDKNAEAKALFQDVLDKSLESSDQNPLATANNLNSFAGFYEESGDYARAEMLYQRALNIRQNFTGLDNPDAADTIENLANLYDDMGDYAKAEPLFRRALDINEKSFGPDNSKIAHNLDGLAGFYMGIGDYSSASNLLIRELQIDEQSLRPDHPNTVECTEKLAFLEGRMGAYSEAKALYEKALEFNQKIYGPSSRHTATSLENLAWIYKENGDYTNAAALFQRALAILDMSLDTNHPDLAQSLNNLAIIYMYEGDYAKAEPLYQRALKINGKSLGPDHPNTAKTAANLALLYIVSHKFDLGLQLASRVGLIQEKELANILRFASEQQRLEFQKTIYPYALFAMLGSATNLALSILHNKGVVLDSLLEDRQLAEASNNPQQGQVFSQLRADKQRLTKLLLEVPRDFSPQAQDRREQDMERLTENIEQLEGGLARQVAGLGRARRAFAITITQVQSSLSKDQILIELVSYPDCVGTNTWVRRYGAVVMASSGEPKWIPIGDASLIETNVARYQIAMHSISSDRELNNILETLYRDVWTPIQAALPANIKTIILSPDGQLNFLSFATLLTPDNQFLAQKYTFGYVASGRDLVLDTKPPSSTQMEIYANPDFVNTGASGKPDVTNTLIASRSVGTRDLGDVYLTLLPGTSLESAALIELATNWGWPTKSYFGANATKAQLLTAKSPRILHLATHGFFLPEDTGQGADRPGVGRGIGGEQPFLQAGFATDVGDGLQPHIFLENPMLRSGLALAGAQSTFDAWKQGIVPPTTNDGIVTAEDVGGLNLEGTWLVTLSACDTGIGEAMTGEGVMGLRRGFIQAGAQNLLMTLWSVDDQETAKLMVNFYTAVQTSGNAPQALADVQRSWLVKLRKERGLAAAVKLAGPFIMSFKGPMHLGQTNCGLAQ